MEIITGYTGKEHVTSEQDRDINIGIIGGGSYVLSTGMQMAAEVSSNNEIKIRDGVLMHQGCAASIKKNTYDSVTIVNGSQGMKRIDLIVARYERNRDTNVESLELHVIQGTPSESSPEVPEHTVGDIQGGALLADMPLYQVTRTGLNITEVKKVFETMDDLETMKHKFTELNGNKISGFGAPESITLPYTAKSDGILQIYAAAKAAGSAYYYIRIGGRATRLQIQNGGVASASFPVRKAEKVEIEETNNIGTVSLTYIPFL